MVIRLLGLAVVQVNPCFAHWQGGIDVMDNGHTGMRPRASSLESLAISLGFSYIPVSPELGIPRRPQFVTAEESKQRISDVISSFRSALQTSSHLATALCPWIVRMGSVLRAVKYWCGIRQNLE